MTRVLFLHGAPDRSRAAVTWLTSRAADDTDRVVVYLPDPVALDAIDRLLWTASGTGFIAHCRSDNPLAMETPVVLASSLSTVPDKGCLLNLSDEIPPDFDRFGDLVEIISTDDAVRLPGRERFRIYRDRGCALTNVDLGKAA
jgi:DNA polymerase III subunit chi